MSAQFLTIATLLSTAIPLVVGTGAFLVTLPWRIDAALQTDLRTHLGQIFIVSEDYVGWTSRSDQNAQRALLSRLVLDATLVALIVTLVQAAAFASASTVPLLWFVSGIFASVIVLLVAFSALWLGEAHLGALINRAVQRHANGKFAPAIQLVLEIREIAQQISDAYEKMGVKAPADVLEICRQAVLEHASIGPGSAVVELAAIKSKSEKDLATIQYLTTLLADARTKLEQIRPLHATDATRESIEQIRSLISSQHLADALQDARWEEAHELLKDIHTTVDQLLASRDPSMPRSLEDAYRILNVGEETPLRSINVVINAYRRVWHPDLAHDEAESRRFKLRMQQIHVAWDIIRKARDQQNEDGKARSK
jgi:hypothetical protein